MGRPKEAAGHLLQGLELAGDAHDCVVALRYDLAEAYLAAGQRTDAIDTFRKVAAADSTFRNVCERIADLSESKA